MALTFTIIPREPEPKKKMVTIKKAVNEPPLAHVKPEGSEPPAKDQSVGYGRPPVRTRFAKGRSGNPSGRPKRRDSFNQMVHRAAMRQVTVQQDGKAERIAYVEALVRTIMAKALKNERVALAWVLKNVPPIYESESAKAEAAAKKEAGEFLLGLSAFFKKNGAPHTRAGLEEQERQAEEAKREALRRREIGNVDDPDDEEDGALEPAI